tara:strand:- start:1340 stop:1714 length:375 start_codon:yes stop_codon:yes gene_type:complete
MTHNINKTLEKDILTIEVVCNMKTFLTDKTNILTTDFILDIIKKDYKIEKIISQPSHKVGNTTRSKIKLSGTWKFKVSRSQVEEKVEEKQIEEKPKQKRKYTRKTKQTESSSIRNRISSLSKKN